jgi:cation diffusion facilitator CzcD-associated flavoprotein CzcO
VAGEHRDVVIIGAGISGIGAACRLSMECPDRSYLILERRQQLGGTWDLFRYPGVRSDSDMYTFGYDFRPWPDTQVVADGPKILEYLRDTAAEYGVPEHIRFGRKVVSARWSTPTGTWTIESVDEATGERHTTTANVLLCCTGYYNYDTGYRPAFPGEDRFTGRIVHPQQWPDDLDYAGKRVVIIGSGATAMTLVPAMAPDAAHITMLQRSPGYVVSVPADDKISELLAKALPEGAVYRLARARNIAIQRAMYAFARRRPELARKLILRGAERHLAGASDLGNFAPRYDPWDQRLCIVPNANLFRAIRSGRAEVVTDTVDSFTETGIRLASGAELTADIIVVATGLDVQLLGGASMVIDGVPLDVDRKVTYKAVLLEDVPNAAVIFGYTNASWTLKADLAARYLCRLLNHMSRHGYTQFVAHATDADRTSDSVLGSLNAGYVRRGNDHLPRQGTRGVWRVTNNYYRDRRMLRRAPVEDGVLRFRAAPAENVAEPPRVSA